MVNSPVGRAELLGPLGPPLSVDPYSRSWDASSSSSPKKIYVGTILFSTQFYKIKTYNCKQCFKSFKQTSNLEMHMAVHTKSKGLCLFCM